MPRVFERAKTILALDRAAIGNALKKYSPFLPSALDRSDWSIHATASLLPGKQTDVHSLQDAGWA
jgi:hypothetical protein